jgi:tetratricopeptide (TPR) repeat protein/Tol biopolymer transport system component
MGNAASEIAARRGTNVAELSKRLNKELEWIPLKAMRKDRTRRYTSASEFADDINNYLSDKPLLAGPETAIYRLRKAVHKYRIPVIAVSAVIVTLIAGMIVSTSLYMRLRVAHSRVSQMEQQAEVNSQRAEILELYERGQIQVALDRFSELLATHGLSPEDLLFRAQLLIEGGQSELAEEELMEFAQAGPNIAGTAHYLLARLYVMDNIGKAEQHKQLAESMLPDTPEGYYVRALTAASADEALTWLSMALELDPGHYAARKALAFAHYSNKAFQEMAADADILKAMHPDDYMGYALSAIAHRELGQFEQALKDHARAIDLCIREDELPRLYKQRRITYMQCGKYKEALEDSELMASLRGEETGYLSFSAMMALEQYDRIEAQYKQIAKKGKNSIRGVKTDAEICVFELMQAKHTFSLPTDIAPRAPFYFMAQAADLYTRLRETAEPLSILGGLWRGDWSPDGQSIVYNQFKALSWLPGSLGGISSEVNSRFIEIMDLGSGKARQIAGAGYSLTWSPDGSHIAYMDDYTEEANIWVAPSLEGGQPRKLVKGMKPNWSRDSKQVFFWADANDRGIYSMHIDRPETDPVLVMESQPERGFACFCISPDNSLIAFEQKGNILVLTFPEGKEVARWELPWPLQLWNFMLQWHPNGKTLILNSTSQYNQMGMCLLDTDSGDMTHVFNVSRPWCRTLWSHDGSKLLICPYAQDDWWLWDIDPSIPLTETLAPALTTEEFLTQRLEAWDQRIKADPLYADNYVSRAVVFMALKAFDSASQDLNRCATLITESNDPAIVAIDYWAGMYRGTGRTVETELWSIQRAQLAKRFPDAFPQPE